MMHNEGFGKKWIERILGKVDKDQGVANAGKVLGIGADGIVTPVEQSGGGGTRLTGAFSITEFIGKVTNGELKVGNTLSFIYTFDRRKISSAELLVINEASSLKALTNIQFSTSSYGMSIEALVTKIESQNGITTISLLPSLMFSNTDYDLSIGAESLTQRESIEAKATSLTINNDTLFASVSGCERIVVDNLSIVNNIIDSGFILGGSGRIFGNVIVK